ncbi:MAG: hypothetical protein P8127_13880 [Acidobacteriota bacterium]
MRYVTQLIVILAAMEPLAVLASENVHLSEIEYQDWSRPKAGDALPVGGPVIRVFSEGGDRFDFVGHTNQPVRFHGLLTGACARVNKISYLQFKIADTTTSVSHPGGRGAWFSRTGVVDVPHDELMKAVPAQLAPLISDLEYKVDRPSYVGRCPVGLKFTGSITTSRKGTVKYRSVAHDGSASPTYTLQFGSAGKKMIGVWGETLSEPDPSGTLALGANDGAGPDYQGWRRLEIVEPHGFAPSPPAEYSVTCQEQPLTLQAAPSKPTSAPKRIRE